MEQSGFVSLSLYILKSLIMWPKWTFQRQGKCLETCNEEGMGDLAKSRPINRILWDWQSHCASGQRILSIKVVILQNVWNQIRTGHRNFSPRENLPMEEWIAIGNSQAGIFSYLCCGKLYMPSTCICLCMYLYI
jgi:hypothetical protein